MLLLNSPISVPLFPLLVPLLLLAKPLAMVREAICFSSSGGGLNSVMSTSLWRDRYADRSSLYVIFDNSCNLTGGRVRNDEVESYVL